MIEDNGGVIPRRNRLSVIVQTIPKVSHLAGLARVLAEEIADANTLVVIDGDRHVAILGQFIRDGNTARCVVVDEAFQPKRLQFSLFLRNRKLSLVLDHRGAPAIPSAEHEDTINFFILDPIGEPLITPQTIRVAP